MSRCRDRSDWTHLEMGSTEPISKNVMSRKRDVTKTWCHENVMSRKRGVTKTWCHENVVSRKRDVTKTWCHFCLMSRWCHVFNIGMSFFSLLSLTMAIMGVSFVESVSSWIAPIVFAITGWSCSCSNATIVFSFRFDDAWQFRTNT